MVYISKQSSYKDMLDIAELAMTHIVEAPMPVALWLNLHGTGNY